MIMSIHVILCGESVKPEVGTLPKAGRVEDYLPPPGTNVCQSPDKLAGIKLDGYFVDAMRENFGENLVR